MSKYISSTVLCSRAIKAELKKTFPGVKFSVKSEVFSGGDCVNINYTDSTALIDEVDEVIKKYSQGYFGRDNYGNDDIYVTYPNLLNLPRAKYVIATRNMSEHIKKELDTYIRKIYHIDDNDYHGGTPFYMLRNTHFKNLRIDDNNYHNLSNILLKNHIN